MGRPMQFETDTAVDRAMDLFWRQGYAGTTPQELASELGIGKGSLYNTFESKHALFMRALRRYSKVRIEYLAGMFSAPGPIGPRLKRAMTVLAGVGEHRRGCVMVNAAAELGTADDDVNRIAEDLFTRIETEFRQAIAQGQESGEFSMDRAADTAASQLLASVIGLSVLVKAGGPSERFQAVIDGIVDGL
ncbi:TetR/AcrR family transcriptional regulator [Arthrobacter sp. AZCC_0090]|uniref:TetR/AcrR family transcriptional regulator n=1 Tax=Arthrobacter sp. AZCC_0090 TaxID=2735881 RepID=UPI0016220666|nr:TetR/AcrR family transcriptional regulator [Arthrobacter sp. AZCC_0090]MBB6403411.1 TetR/AcrR family transcriptional repressor of nem operon [Arthrobacter sp. AZCC_0090]